MIDMTASVLSCMEYLKNREWFAEVQETLGKTTARVAETRHLISQSDEIIESLKAIGYYLVA
jgi:hypothetical protein